jgi:hypothetical protein
MDCACNERYAPSCVRTSSVAETTRAERIRLLQRSAMPPRGRWRQAGSTTSPQLFGPDSALYRLVGLAQRSRVRARRKPPALLDVPVAARATRDVPAVVLGFPYGLGLGCGWRRGSSAVDPVKESGDLPVQRPKHLALRLVRWIGIAKLNQASHRSRMDERPSRLTRYHDGVMPANVGQVA